jgi:F-type H+-transporting ATPase subunit epsilon
MSKLSLVIIVPGQAPVSREADAVTLTGEDGVFTLLSAHTALLARLRPGVARLVLGGKEEFFALGSGVCEVVNDQVTVLAERLVEWGDIRHRDAVAMIEQARAKLPQVIGPVDPNWDTVHDELAWAEAVSSITEAH